MIGARTSTQKQRRRQHVWRGPADAAVPTATAAIRADPAPRATRSLLELSQPGVDTARYNSTQMVLELTHA